MQDVLDVPFVALDYETRLEKLTECQVGLWDCIAEATRPGSLDAAIRDISINPLAELVTSLRELELIAYNGGKAAALGRRALGRCAPVETVSLPSSSPAYTLDYDAKRGAWKVISQFLV